MLVVVVLLKNREGVFFVGKLGFSTSPTISLSFAPVIDSKSPMFEFGERHWLVSSCCRCCCLLLSSSFFIVISDCNYYTTLPCYLVVLCFLILLEMAGIYEDDFEVRQQESRLL